MEERIKGVSKTTALCPRLNSPPCRYMSCNAHTRIWFMPHPSSYDHVA